jgi:nitrate reductase NapD
MSAMQAASPCPVIELYVAGVLVHVSVHALDRVSHAIGALREARVHASSPQGKLVVTLEASSRDTVASTLSRIEQMPGVLSARLVYEHAEQVDDDARGNLS